MRARALNRSGWRNLIAHPTKIATCCYCGTRAALVLRGRDRHELACSACGAPLHEMKMLRSERLPVRQDRAAPPSDRSVPQRPVAPRKKPKKRRKGLLRKLAEEAFDVIEDIFD